MKRQLQGIGIILFSIMMILGMGDEPVFDLSLKFSYIFVAIGVYASSVIFVALFCVDTVLSVLCIKKKRGKFINEKGKYL